MVSACLDAYRVHSDRRWLIQARWAFNWFLGENHLQHWLFDPATGGCRDGLHVDRPNQNRVPRRPLVPARPARLRTITALDVPGVPAQAYQSYDVAAALRNPLPSTRRQSHSDGG